MAGTAEPLDIGEALRCARFLLTAYAWPRTPARLVQHRRHLELLTATGRFARETSRSDVDTQWISTAEAATILDVNPQYVRRIAASLDGRRTAGNSWIFDRKAVEQYAAQRNRRHSG